MVEHDIYDLAERFFGVTSGKNLTFGTLAERRKPAETQRNSGLFTVPSVAFLPLDTGTGASYAGINTLRISSENPPVRDIAEDDCVFLDLGPVLGEWEADVGRVGKFPHARILGDKDLYRISPANTSRMRDPDALGQTRCWILEVHLVDRAQTFGGFYERLLVPG
jgi:hypothetical protein